MKKGFTLMEILISIAIIAILTAIGIVSYGSINRNARNAKRRTDIEQLRSAYELYRADNGYYPASGLSSMEDASTLLSSPVTPPFDTYMSSIPVDPKGQEYKIQVLNEIDGAFYGYCIAAQMEPSDAAVDSTCGATVTLPEGYNYARKNP